MAKRKETPLVRGRLAQTMGGGSPAPIAPPLASPAPAPAGATSPAPAQPSAASAAASRAPADLFVGSTRMIDIALLRRDDSTQGRVKINPSTVDEYADAIEKGAQFPAVKVFFDGTHHWLADGFHRTEAHIEAKRTQIAAEITSGTHEDAILYAAGPANARHGLRRTTADKRRSIEMVLALPGWAKHSDREIADHCQVTDKTVGAVRRALLAKSGGEAANERTGKDGRTYRLPTKPAAVTATLDRLEKEILPAAGIPPASAERPVTPPAVDDRDTTFRSQPGGQLSDVGLRVDGERRSAVAAPAAPLGKPSDAVRASLETTLDTLDMLLVALAPGERNDLRAWAEEGRRLAQAHLSALD